MSISVIGAGAFGTALAVSLAQDGKNVSLWARDRVAVDAMVKTRVNSNRLPGVTLPDTLDATSDIALGTLSRTVLLAIPMQNLSGLLQNNTELFSGKRLVACCKGIDLNSLTGPSAVIADCVPDAIPAILTGPSFATDIARGLPTALTLACEQEDICKDLQHDLSTSNLRLYRTADVVGAELGGALKNVIAIACGISIGAGLGDSARAAIMTRGYAEMTRLAAALGARPETLSGLSGFGDLALTCTSEQSRNYRFGLALGAGQQFDPSITVEGAATAKAVSNLAGNRQIDMPIATVISNVVNQNITVSEAISSLLARPLRKE